MDSLTVVAWMNGSQEMAEAQLQNRGKPRCSRDSYREKGWTDQTSSEKTTSVELACAQWQCQTSVRHMFWTNPKAVWSRRLRKHTSESVLMVSDLLCTRVQRTRVQGNTQEHKQGNAREMCSCWETVNTPPHVNRERGVTPKTQKGSHKGARQQLWIRADKSTSSQFKEVALRALKNIDFKLTHGETGDRLSMVRSTRATPPSLSRIFLFVEIGRFSLSSEFSNLIGS